MKTATRPLRGEPFAVARRGQSAFVALDRLARDAVPGEVGRALGGDPAQALQLGFVVEGAGDARRDLDRISRIERHLEVHRGSAE